MRVPFEAVAEARLVLTDDLIRDALRQDKKLRQERKKRRGAPQDAAEAEIGPKSGNEAGSETGN